MSTYLALAQKLRQECSDNGTGPSTVVSQTGEARRWVDWVADYWTELQNEQETWRWMRKSFTVPTVSGTGTYAYNATSLVDTVSNAAVTRWAKWYFETFTCYLQSVGVGTERELVWLDWDTFRREYRVGTQTDSTPIHVSQDPTGSFVLGPKPNAVFVISGDYQIGPQTLAADADVPEMPTRFHHLLVYGAMIKYGGFRIATEAMVRAKTEGTRLKRALERDQLPEVILAGPLT